MSTHPLRDTDDDRAFDARFAAMLPPVVPDDLAHARSRRALVAAAEDHATRPSRGRKTHLRVVTVLAFAAATAAAATVATRAYLAAHAPDEGPRAAVATRASGASAWRADAVASTPAPEVIDAPPASPQPPSQASRAVAERGPRTSAPAAPSSSRSAAPTASAPVDGAASTAGERFTEAMRAYLTGDFATAEARFDAFCIDDAEDARAEDAAFLRADARAKRGDLQGARAAARSYLKRYPNGLRRPEAERLASIGL